MLAARWGVMFQCDPMTFLDRETHDLPVLLAVMRAASREIERMEARHK